MPEKAGKAQKEMRLSIRTTDQEKLLLAMAAKARNLNVSQFVLQTSIDAAQAILADQTYFRLPAEQWDAFCRRLDEEPKEIPALRKLFRESKPFDGR